MKPTPLILLLLVALSARKSVSEYTTLLEDEQDSQDEASLDKPKPSISYGRLIYEQPDDQSQGSEGASSNDAATTKTTTTTTNTSTNATAAEGNDIATGQAGGVQASGAKAAGGDSTVFTRIYSKISSYLPFLAQLSILRQGGVRNTTTSNDSEPHAKTNISVSMVRDITRQAERELSLKGAGQQAPDSSSSGSSNGNGNGNGNGAGESNSNSNSNSNNNNINNYNNNVNYDNTNGEPNQDNHQALNNDKQELNVDASTDRKDDDDEGESGNHDEQEAAVNTYNRLVGQFGRPLDQVAVNSLDAAELQQPPPDKFKSGGLKRDQQYIFEDDDNVDTQDVDMNQVVPVPFDLANLQNYWNQQAGLNEQQNEQPNDPTTRYNLMRQSNLVMPMRSPDDMLTSTSSEAQRPIGRPSERLLGKYIYAPTQHYYLNSVMPPHLTPGAIQQHHAAKPLQPGDQIYSSYAPSNPMKAEYSFQKEPNSLGDKPNDLYFLIMVGAFCMMATTVVLAAGLFAYRIQQNRKSSQDTGYPTYGVVGPNNISGKCGAASLVGGYFMGPPGGEGTSKSGSVRHLADLYGNVSNGTGGGSDSGLVSLDKSSSNKKASSSSSLNEFHQPSSGRATSSNFMTAAASQDAARMYHYQHQKQQMIISDRNSGGRHTTASDLDSEDENDDGSYTVYECPGLAPAHEMEIKNPLFTDDQSP